MCAWLDISRNHLPLDMDNTVTIILEEEKSSGTYLPLLSINLSHSSIDLRVTSRQGLSGPALKTASSQFLKSSLLSSKVSVTSSRQKWFLDAARFGNYDGYNSE